MMTPRGHSGHAIDHVDLWRGPRVLVLTLQAEAAPQADFQPASHLGSDPAALVLLPVDTIDRAFGVGEGRSDADAKHSNDAAAARSRVVQRATQGEVHEDEVQPVRHRQTL